MRTNTQLTTSRRVSLAGTLLVLASLTLPAYWLAKDTQGKSAEARQVWLIGWDGMAPWIVEPMIAANKLPNLKKLMESGSSGELESLHPARSPALWTTIATGKAPAEHGVEAFWKEDLETGKERLYSVHDRTAAPLWQIADKAGLTSAIVGWWVTWPAEPIRGSVVSDRFAPSRFKIHPNALASGSPGKTPPVEGIVSPSSLSPVLADCLRTPESINGDEMAQFVEGNQEPAGALKLHSRQDELRIVFARDETHWCIAKQQVETLAPDFLALHVQGTDIVNHYFLKYRYPELWESRSLGEISPQESQRFQDTIEKYYIWQDRRLGELLRLAGPETVVFVLSDHGFKIGTRPRIGTVSGIHSRRPAPPGFFVVSGPGIRPGHRVHGAHILDIAPSVLSLWGLPVARDQPGSVLIDAMVNPPRLRFIDSYGDGSTPSPALDNPDLDIDRRVIQSLKSLGYVNQ